MFRRLTNRLSAAVSGGQGSNDSSAQQPQDNVSILQGMGFSAEQARNALLVTDGNVERAAEYLLSSSVSNTSISPQSSNYNNNNNNNSSSNSDAALSNALQESLQSEEERLYRQAQQASIQQQTTRVRSAASHKAGNAAMQRTKNTKNTKNKTSSRASSSSSPPKKPLASTPGYLSQDHPQVKVPVKLQDKSKEEQILRCADRLKGHPTAVDTLIKALTALRNDASNPYSKFRTIDQTTAGYKRSLASAPGASSMFLALNFVQRNPTTLVLQNYDPALVYLGISALESVRSSPEYTNEKQMIRFRKEIRDIQLSANSSESEAIQRAGYLAKCPTEPPSGRGALLQVIMGESMEDPNSKNKSNTTSDNKHVVKRRFDGDDVLRDVVNWLGGHGSIIPDKLLSREWCLVDLNRYPMAPINVEINMDRTLQYIGCWPSGRLEIRPSPPEWKISAEQAAQKALMGSSRGLGAAPTEAMNIG